MKLLSIFSYSFLFLFLISSFGYSQTTNNSHVDIIDHLSLDHQLQQKGVQSYNQAKTHNNTVASFDPVARIWEQTPWLDEQINFKPFSRFISMGDINGDGADDLAKRFTTPDERDSDINTYTTKSLIYFGGENLSTDFNQLFYSTIYPLGDLNGDGFADAVSTNIDRTTATLYSGSSSGLSSTQSSETENLITLFDRSFSSGTNQINTISIKTGKSINEDSFEDIYGYYRDDMTGFKYFEVYGASDFNNVSYAEITLPEETLQYDDFSRLTIGDSTYLAFYSLGMFENGTQPRGIALYNLHGLDSLSLKSFHEIPHVFETFHISDLDGNETPDLIVTNRFGDTYYFDGTDENRILESSELINNPFDNFAGPYLLGDIMGDSRSEILYGINNSFEIVNFDSSSTSFVSIKTVSSDSLLSNSSFSFGSEYSFPENVSIYPGFNTFSVQIQSDEKFGNVILKVQNGSNDIESEIFLENAADYSIKVRDELFHLSDLEGDGTDNFGVREVTGLQDRLVIMNGINDQNPLIIENPDPENYNIRTVESGLFNSATDRSIAILLRPKNRFEDPSQFLLFDLDDLSTPYFSLLSNEIDPNVSIVDIFSNVGDINNDGFDDLVLSPVMSVPRKVFIYLGKTEMTAVPDVILDLNDDFPNPVRGGTSFGASLVQGLGDINSDGIDDFALGDGNRFYNTDLAFRNQFISGVIYVLYGQDSDSLSYDGPDLELRADTSNIENRQFFFGGINSLAVGDFDGDELKDIVSIPVQHSNSSFTEGVGALSYFFGKDGFTNQPDTTIPIRTEYIFSDNENIEEEYSRFTGRALLKSIPDLNGDNSDELLFVGGSSYINAVLYEVGNSPTEVATALYTPPNKNFGLHNAGAFINKQYLPLVGDYNGDGRINFLGYQPNDLNFRDTPAYMYEVDNIAVSIAEDVDENPTEFSLDQNYPNPFNPSTNISFSIPRSGNVEIIVYNILGQEISKVVNRKFNSGAHSITFDASNLASGIYLYSIKSGDFISTKRMTLIK